MTIARRIYFYVMAFAGLITFLLAGSGLVALTLSTLLLPSDILATTGLRTQVSFYLAALVVGVPVWFVHWMAAERLAARSDKERLAFMRRLFLAAVFATTSVVALFALRELLAFALTIPGAPEARSSPLSAIQAGANLLIYGVAWLAYVRIGARARAAAAGAHMQDQLHDLAVYVLSGFSLGFLSAGLWQAVREIVVDILQASGAGSQQLVAAPSGVAWSVWGGIGAWLISGAAIWAGVWSYDLARGGRRQWRVIYLYVALIAAVPAALGGGGYLLYELLRRLFGYQSPDGGWIFLREGLPFLVVGGIVWTYHWFIVRQQTLLDSTTAGQAAGIPWPRRPGLALLALLGLAAATAAFVALVWIGLDFLFDRALVLSGSGWWRDRLSLALAAGPLGAAVWLPAWSTLESAAERDAAERAATARRLYLGIVILAGSISALGFLVAALWLLIRALIGDVLSPGDLARGLRYASAVLAGAALAAYHATVLRNDLSLIARRPGGIRLVVLVTAGAEESLAELRRLPGLEVHVLGHLSDGAGSKEADLVSLHEAVSGIQGAGLPDRALLVLYPGGAKVYAYTP